MNFMLNLLTLALLGWMIWNQRNLREALKEDLQSLLKAAGKEVAGSGSGKETTGGGTGRD